VRVGLCLPQLGPAVDRRAVEDFARSAEGLGFASLWVQEHLFSPLRPSSPYAGIPGQVMPAAYHSTLAPTELLGAVAAWTGTIRLGTSVLVTGYHHPVELAQRLATLDVLSQGRLDVGLGAGWSADEHRLCGVDPATRAERMGEFVRALLVCFGEDPVRFEGRFFSIPEAFVRPKPLQRPHPPLLAGTASRAGLRLATECFDGWNPVGLEARTVRERLRALNASRPAGRAPLSAHLRIFAQSPLAPGPAPGLGRVASAVAEAAEAGLDEVIIDGNFLMSLESPEAWAALPGRLARVLDDLLMPGPPSAS
jgi:probable F420-dependent oxidoreductase